jgi:hypothetical protein
MEVPMTTPDLPDVTQLSSEQLLALRATIDTRLNEMRADFMEKAATLGLAVVESSSKKRKRRSSAHKEHE